MPDKETTLEKWIEVRGTNIHRLAKESGVQRSTIYNLIARPTSGQMETHRKLADALGISIAMLLCNPDQVDLSEIRFKAVPLFEDRRVLSQMVAEQPSPAHFPADLVSNDQVFAFRLAGDELAGYKAGDTFLIDPTITSPNTGDLVLASVRGAPATLYRYLEERGHRWLTFDLVETQGINLAGVQLLGTAVRLDRQRSNL